MSSGRWTTAHRHRCVARHDGARLGDGRLADLYRQVLAADILVSPPSRWATTGSRDEAGDRTPLLLLQPAFNDAGQSSGPHRRLPDHQGNEDGVKHCAMNVLYSLQHLGYTIPTRRTQEMIGEAGPSPLVSRPRLGRPGNDFTNRNTAFMTGTCCTWPGR